MVVGRLISAVARLGRGFLKRGAGLARSGVSVGRALSRRAASLKYDALGRRASLLKRGLTKGKLLARRGGEHVRRAAKGTWRKFSLDPGGTALSAYTAARTPSLRLEFPDNFVNRVHTLERPNYSSW